MKNLKISNYTIFCAIVLFCFAPGVFSQAQNQILPVLIEKQQGNNTCWAACCRMILYWYKNTTVTQDAIVKWAYNSSQFVNGPAPISSTGTPKGCRQVCANYSPYLTTSGSNNVADQNGIVYDIYANHPILAEMERLDGSGRNHAVLIVGHQNYAQTVVYNDPVEWTPNPRYRSYADFLFNTEDLWQWKQTMYVLTPNPNPGIFDGVTIPSGPDILTYPVSTKTYTSNFVRKFGSQATVVSWQWILKFKHSGGNYIVPIGPFNNGPLTSTCTVPSSSFPLPSGYQWQYTIEGNVIGDITVSVMDSDGYPHSNSKWVQYVPQNPYPDYVLYANTTVSKTKPDVKAHSEVDLQNDQFSQGANITFKAGKMINIYSGTFQNGSNTKFVIDESLVANGSTVCPSWSSSTIYNAGDKVCYGNTGYQVLPNVYNISGATYGPTGPFAHFWTVVNDCGCSTSNP